MESSQPWRKPCHVLGVDVGGTKIHACVVELADDGTPITIVAAEQIPTPRVRPSVFYDAIAALIHRLCAQVEPPGRDHLLPLLSVAHPGRFLPDGTLARGTTPNLGETPGQFDGIAVAQELQARLGGLVIAENDAVAQMRFGLHVLLRDPQVRPALLRQTVVYLGPGTGMGGGVARVSADGEVTPITDGHFFDLQIPGYGDGTLTAEELFTGPAIARMVVQANRRLGEPIQPATSEQLSDLLSRPKAPAAHRQEACRIADQAGEILALIIETIHAGRITKVRLEPQADGRLLRHIDEPDRRWSASDRDAVRGVSRILLGGSVGADPALGGHIRARALERLSQRGLSHVKILQLPVASRDAGLLGAVLAIRCEHLRQATLVSVPTKSN